MGRGWQGRSGLTEIKRNLPGTDWRQHSWPSGCGENWVSGGLAWSFDIQTDGGAVPDRILERSYPIAARKRVTSDPGSTDDSEEMSKESEGSRSGTEKEGGGGWRAGNDDFPIAWEDIQDQMHAADRRLVLEPKRLQRSRWICGGPHYRSETAVARLRRRLRRTAAAAAAGQGRSRLQNRTRRAQDGV
jgi:hypothetical protein